MVKIVNPYSSTSLLFQEINNKQIKTVDTMLNGFLK